MKQHTKLQRLKSHSNHDTTEHDENVIIRMCLVVFVVLSKVSCMDR